MKPVVTFVKLNLVIFRYFLKEEEGGEGGGGGEVDFDLQLKHKCSSNSSSKSLSLLSSLLQLLFDKLYFFISSIFCLTDLYTFSLPFRWDLFPIFLILRLEIEDTSFSVKFLLFCCLNFFLISFSAVF